MERKKLVDELQKLQAKEKEVQKQIDALDYEERFAEAKQYEGKYFMEIDPRNKGWIRCIFVYGIHETDCQPLAIGISYWQDRDTHFKIEYESHFNPKKWGEEDMWQEISKIEFDHHYSKALRRVEDAIAQKSENK